MQSASFHTLKLFIAQLPKENSVQKQQNMHNYLANIWHGQKGIDPFFCTAKVISHSSVKNLHYCLVFQLSTY